MNALYLTIIIIIIVLIIFYKFHGNSRKFKDLNEQLDSLKTMNKELQVKNDSTQKAVIESLYKKPEYDAAFKKHMITINSNENTVKVDLPYKLKNVVHVELISGIVPKSQYRINQYNQNVTFDGTTDITLQQGSYTDIISLLMILNQEMYDAGKQVIFVFDSLKRNVVAIANTAVSTMNFEVTNSIGNVLGYNEDLYTFSDPVTDLDANVAASSLGYLSTQKTNSITSGIPINNRSGDYYTFTDQFFSTGSVVIDPTWRYVEGLFRVNMKHQLYVDIDIDEIQYWDGTHRLARVFIAEDRDETEYTSYGTPIRRSLIDDYKNIDKLTFKLFSVVSEGKRYPYELNGLNYSLQVEVTTKDVLLTRGE